MPHIRIELRDGGDMTSMVCYFMGWLFFVLKIPVQPRKKLVIQFIHLKLEIHFQVGTRWDPNSDQPPTILLYYSLQTNQDGSLIGIGPNRGTIHWGPYKFYGSSRGSSYQDIPGVSFSGPKPPSDETWKPGRKGYTHHHAIHVSWVSN